MRTISLLDILKDGSLAGVRPGMSAEEVTDIIGTPDRESDPMLGFGVLTYGNWEFFYPDTGKQVSGFQHDRLLFTIMFRSAEEHRQAITYAGTRIAVDPAPLRAGQDMTFLQLSHILKQEGLVFEVQEEENDLPVILLHSGISLHFDDLGTAWKINETGQAVPYTEKPLEKEQVLLRSLRCFL